MISVLVCITGTTSCTTSSAINNRVLIIRRIMLLLQLFLVTTVNVIVVNGAEFDPYQLNGGLISAVAGKNFIVIATDTRMIGPTGYDILERGHVSSRLWSANTVPVLVQSKSKSKSKVKSKVSVIETQSISTTNTNTKTNTNTNTNNDPGFTSDGSVRIPFYHLHPKLNPFSISSSSLSLSSPSNSIILPDNIVHVSRWNASSSILLLSSLPVLVGSAGCSVDCEILKRTIRSEFRTARYFGESFANTKHVVSLVSQTLYSRRTFPYYSFCIVAGLSSSSSTRSSSTSNGRGQVFVYDAIGSYEQVPVACTGTGRELLQPILDCKFTTSLSTTNNNRVKQQFHKTDTTNSNDIDIDIDTDDEIIVKKLLNRKHRQQQQQQQYRIREKSTIIDESISIDEVITTLINAYRSVSEREIGVGDQIVLYTIEYCPRCTTIQQQSKEIVDNINNKDNDDSDGDGNGDVICNVYTAPLKKH